MSAVSAAIAFAQYNMGVQRRLAILTSKIADQGQQLDLLIDIDGQILPRVAIKIPNPRAMEAADAAQARAAEMIVFGKLQKQRHHIVTFVEHQGEGLELVLLKQKFGFQVLLQYGVELSTARDREWLDRLTHPPPRMVPLLFF